MKIELLLAYEDNTWTTEIIDCPDELDRNNLNAVQNWTINELCEQIQYQKVVLFGVYNSEPEQDTDDPRLEEDDHVHNKNLE